MANENAQSIKVLDQLMSTLTIAKSEDETNAATTNIASFINGPIEEADAPTKCVFSNYLVYGYLRHGTKSAMRVALLLRLGVTQIARFLFVVEMWRSRS